MKTGINKLKLILLLALTLNLGLLKAQEPLANGMIEVKGRVLHLSDKNGSTYKAELIYNNRVLDSVIVRNNKTFLFSVPQNVYYAIRISKNGYITRLISLFTQMPEENDAIYRFEFDTELIEEKLGQDLDADALDFPIAIIAYEKELRNFYYNEEYTSNIKRSLFNAAKDKSKKNNN